MDLMGGSGGPASSDPKATIIQQVQQEMAITNARMLITKLNDNCYEKCIPSPGTSLSGKESTCLTTCMEKYMAAWNQVSRTYIERAQKGAASIGGAAGGSDSGFSM